MKLGENIFNLRKKKGLSQENLAEAVNVSRQTISNWELGSTAPNPEQLKMLSKVLNISIDNLLDNTLFINDSDSKKNLYGYEYISKIRIKGVPLVHINLGLGHGIRKAKGMIAIGNIAKGVFALGGIAMGLISLGGVSLGLVALGGLALGILLSIGGLSIGSIALGGVAIGLFSIGGLAIGLYSTGGVSFAKYVAKGDYAHAYIAIGNHVKGVVQLIETEVSSSEIRHVIVKHFPKTWDFIVFILSNVGF